MKIKINILPEFIRYSVKSNNIYNILTYPDAKTI